MTGDPGRTAAFGEAARITRRDNGMQLDANVLLVFASGALLASAREIHPLGVPVSLRLSSWPHKAHELEARVAYGGVLGDGLHAVGVRFERFSRSEAQVTERHRRDLRGRAAGVRLGELFSAATDLEGFCCEHPWAFLVPRPARGPADEGALRPDQLVFPLRAHDDPSLWQSVTLGRDASCDVVLHSRQISRRHAVFERDPDTGEYLVIDRSTRNGTCLDGRVLRPYQPGRLRSGALLELGPLRFEFLSAEALALAACRSGVARLLPSAPRGGPR